MKHLTKIFQALLGVGALILTALIATGRLAWRIIRSWWRKHTKCRRNAISIILLLFTIGFIALTAYTYYENKYGREYWNDYKLSENIEVHAFKNSTLRVYDRQKKKYTTPNINWVSGTDDNDSLAVYAIPHKRGYINANSGEIIIDANENNYSKAWIFSEGLAAVMKEGKIGFINTNNETVIPFQFNYSHNHDDWEFGYLFHNGHCTMTDKNGNMGLIDTSGKWSVEPIYDSVSTPQNKGYRIITNEGKSGILDSECNIVYPVEYDYVYLLSDGIILAKEGKKWQADYEGNIIQPFMFDGTYYLNYPIGYNEAGEIKYIFADYVKYRVTDYYGIMNRISGEPLTPALYSEINMLSEELFEVQDPESYDWYLIDAKGNILSAK